MVTGQAVLATVLCWSTLSAAFAGELERADRPRPADEFLTLLEACEGKDEDGIEVVIEYAETVCALASRKEPTAVQQKAHSELTRMDNLKQVIDQGSTILAYYKEHYKIGPDQRKREMEKLILALDALKRIVTEQKQAELRAQVRVRKPTKEEEDLLEKALTEIRDLFQKREYEKLIRARLLISKTSPQDYEGQVRAWARTIKGYDAERADAFYSSLLSKRENWYMYADNKAALIRVKADAAKLGKDFVVMLMVYQKDEGIWRFQIGHACIPTWDTGPIPIK